MARSLPIEQSLSIPSPGALHGSVQVFDPAMCCPTGLCGPGVDPALLVITRDLRWLEAQGVKVDRYGLAQAPDAFVSEPKVAGLMQAFGDRGLPATLVNGEVLTFGKYPTRDEVLAALDGAQTRPSDTESCCKPGTGCC